MSTNIHWRPNIKPEYKTLSKELKWAFQNEFGNFFNLVLDESYLRYLRGLRYAKIEGADILIDAIEKHGEIKVWEDE